jgi:hypothetical protein
MKIAILGWGSLIWDRRDLKVAADFVAGGPILPVEFCRISADGRLTLVIEETHGSLCATYHAPSVYDDLRFARENLSLREGTANVGFVNLITGDCTKRHPNVVSKIGTFAPRARPIIFSARFPPRCGLEAVIADRRRIRRAAALRGPCTTANPRKTAEIRHSLNRP